MCDEVADAATVSLVVQSLCNEVASAAAESAHSSEIVGLGLAARYLPEIDDYLYVDIGVTGKDTPVRGRRYKTSRFEEYKRKKALSEETKRARKYARDRESYQRNPAKKKRERVIDADPQKKRERVKARFEDPQKKRYQFLLLIRRKNGIKLGLVLPLIQKRNENSVV